MTQIHHPHDALTKTFLNDLTVAKDFLKAHLPGHIRERCDFNTLKVITSSLVNQKLTQYATDILYSLNINGIKGFIYCLVEAQSKPEVMMPFRLWHYASMVIKQFLDDTNHKNQKLPVVIPILFYTGAKSPYPYSLELSDCFEDSALAKEVLFKAPILIDLSIIPDEELNTHGDVALLEIVQKHIRTRDILALAERFCHTVNHISIRRHLFLATLEYIINQKDDEDFEGFLEVLNNHLDEHRSDTMTIAERLVQKGVQQGREQAIQETMSIADRLVQRGREQAIQETKQQQQQYVLETARNFLLSGVEASVIAKALKLDLADVLKLKQSMTH